MLRSIHIAASIKVLRVEIVIIRLESSVDLPRKSAWLVFGHLPHWDRPCQVFGDSGKHSITTRSVDTACRLACTARSTCTSHLSRVVPIWSLSAVISSHVPKGGQRMSRANELPAPRNTRTSRAQSMYNTQRLSSRAPRARLSIFPILQSRR